MSVLQQPLLSVRVAQKTVEAEGIAGFVLAGTDGAPLPLFEAGAHIDVHVAEGLVRQYSLCNAAGNAARYQIGVLRDPASRGGSLAMHDVVTVGDVLKISAPKNHFPLHPGAQRSLLFAGGIGVTPILAMAEHLSRARAAFEMHYCTRAAARTAYLERIQRSPFANSVRLHHDDGPAEQKLDLSLSLAKPDSATHVYVCGPSGFMNAVIATAKDRGWSDEQIHFEYFSGGVVHAADDASFDVVLKSSGKVIRVEAAKTVVQALAEHGIEVPTSCEQGVCGTCLTRVLEGEPDHKDLFLTPTEQAKNDQFLPCCSRAKSRSLLLDL